MPSIHNRALWWNRDGVAAATEEARTVGYELDEPSDLGSLVDRLSEDRYVLLGEASHGTSEFYRWRAWLTAQLVREYDVAFVAVEGDWTDCYEVNRYVKGRTGEKSAPNVLETFERWPTWMWANWEMIDFIEWLREYNAARTEEEKVGFYGLDVYSLFESMAAVIEYLEKTDPDAADEVRNAYHCFEPYGDDAREYARATRLAPESCEDEVIEVLTRLQDRLPEYEDSEEEFNAEQNALVAKNAEKYYRAMVGLSEDSWNIRDRHMMETAQRLLNYHDGRTGIIWAHNTHIGDARATDMSARGRLNIGQLARERADPADVSLVGFGSHHGSVIAGEAWDAPMEEMTVPSAEEGSIEDVLHQAGGDRLLFTDEIDETDSLAAERGHRAIGVVYDPTRESGNYVPTVLPDRYDAFVHIDVTEALHPLDLHTDRDAISELYPWGL